MFLVLRRKWLEEKAPYSHAIIRRKLKVRKVFRLFRNTNQNSNVKKHHRNENANENNSSSKQTIKRHIKFLRSQQLEKKRHKQVFPKQLSKI